ncbi:MAG: alpha/beta hydrolase [Bdellovibrionota bacterium]
MSGEGDFLPFEGEWGRARERRFRETIVFVHHFGGSKRTVLRHVKMANDLGFDTVRFPLMFNKVLPAQQLPITADLKFGARHVWAGQIESVLNSIPGKKIVYSFSMPSNGALEAIAKRRAKDVSAWVSDGGPFLQVLKCSWNLFEHQWRVQSKLLRGLFTGFSYFIFGHGLDQESPKFIAMLPDGFHVLSIRGGKDPLVPQGAIEDVFKTADKIALERLVIPDGVHLDGLKNHEAEYLPVVSRFLKAHATPV